jgi:hypothetical protein
VPDDRLAAAVAELYGAAPEGFTERRTELATAARDAGDRAAAKAIGALRRPTRAAWVVNQLARTDPSAPGKLAELAGALRAAQEAKHGPRLRELSAARGALIDALTAQALAAASVPDPPASLRLEVSETLTAALADPGVAAAFATGTLTRAMQWSGFGVLPADADAGTDEVGTASTAASGAGSSRAAATAETAADADDSAARSRERDAGRQPSPGRARSRPVLTEVAQPRRRAGQAGTSRAAEATAARQQAAEAELLALAEERAARQREQYAEAERVVASASRAAAEALSAEDQLEAEVRDLEQRLTQARADLAAARMRARHAEAAERRARQALDRLSLASRRHRCTIHPKEHGI